MNEPRSTHLFARPEHLAPVNVPVQTAYEIEQFLYAEADLLDAWQFRDWLALLAPDVQYRAPVRENRLAREIDQEMYAPGTAAYFDETLPLLTERVNRLYTNMGWSETPPSRTRHLVSNVRVHTAPDAADEYAVQSSFHIYRSSGERHQDAVVGKRFDRLRRAPTPYGFVIARRTVVFDMATLLVKNLSLFY